ncbi:hypothetical protein CC80DRAFT_497001 [Byssothecium circinans]|uniref:Uncharacterized protein n=1 Tax=Byssothecium circinans TaxID=147558 RepID=A0A6A5TET9_9PLEO|nr:hypothetical protein CC80DRAFT_497001 [Byssothecium circinans]
MGAVYGSRLRVASMGPIYGQRLMDTGRAPYHGGLYAPEIVAGLDGCRTVCRCTVGGKVTVDCSDCFQVPTEMTLPKIVLDQMLAGMRRIAKYDHVIIGHPPVDTIT